MKDTWRHLRFTYLHILSQKKVSHLRNMHSNETVYCVGSGPSVNSTNFSLLNDKVVIFTNQAIKLIERCKPKAAYSIITDYFRLRELRTLVIRLPLSVLAAPNHLLDPSIDVQYYGPPVLFLKPATVKVNRFQQDADNGIGFSFDILRHVFLGHSVIFSAIQVAAFLGAKNIVCLGVDMDYSGSAKYFDKTVSRGAWDGFDYEIHGRKMFEHFHDQLKSKNMRLINSTPGGRVDVLERIPLEQVVPL